jgi:hypothetical protein
MKTVHELYDGKLKLTFDDFRHTYVLDDGTKVPSVTSILSVISKPALVSWAANQATDYVISQIKPGVAYDEVQLNTIFQAARKAHTQREQETADIGSMIHEWIRKFIKGENPDLPVNELMRQSINNFLKWKEEHNVKFILSEQPVYSKEYGYCGTLDFVASIDKSLFLGDIKTSNAIYKEYLLQLAAYGIARSEEFPNEDYKAQGIIRISRDGSFEFTTSKDPNACFDAFLAAKNLYDWQQSCEI